MSEDKVEIIVDSTRFDEGMAKIRTGLTELGGQYLVCRCAYRGRVDSAVAFRIYRCEVCVAGLGPDYAADGDVTGRQQ